MLPVRHVVWLRPAVPLTAGMAPGEVVELERRLGHACRVRVAGYDPRIGPPGWLRPYIAEPSA